MSVFTQTMHATATQVALRIGFTALALIVFSGCFHPEVPLRYRKTDKSCGFSTVVSEWGVLAGTDPEGERTEVRIVGPDGGGQTCCFEAFGRVTDSWCADLDADGKPEVIVTTESYGTGAYGEVWVVTLSTNGLSKATLPDLTIDEKKGYSGHDVFQRGGERRIIRTFPVYLEGDANCLATGGTRMVVYAFRNGRLIVADKRDIPPVNRESTLPTDQNK